MKRASILGAVLCLTSCATAIPYSPKEQCALDDMKLAGLQHGTSSGTAFTDGTVNTYGSRGYAATSNYSGSTTVRSSYTGVSCVIPDTEQDKCEIVQTKQIIAPKVDYNSGIGGKRFVTGLGYVIYILPGIAAKLIYDSEYNDAVNESRKVESSLAGKCDARIPASKD